MTSDERIERLVAELDEEDALTARDAVTLSRETVRKAALARAEHLGGMRSAVSPPEGSQT